MRVIHIILASLIAIGLSPAFAQDTATDFESAYRQYQQKLREGDVKAALDSSGEALTLGLEKFGREHETSAILAFNYSKMLTIDGEKEGAAKMAIVAREIAEKAHGPSSPELIKYLREESIAQLNYSQHDEALEAGERGLDLTEEIYGRKSLEYADFLVVASSADTKHGWRQKSKSRLQSAIEIYSETLEQNDPRSARAKFDLAKYYEAWGMRNKAIEHFNASIDAWSTDKPRYLSLIMTARTFLVSSYSEKGMIEEATAQSKILGQEMVGHQDGNAESQPLYRKRPVYPLAAAQKGTEGWVHLSFTIDTEGFVKEIEIIRVEGHKSFGPPAKDALEEWRYAPKVIDGNFVPRHNNEIIMTFKLDK